MNPKRILILFFILLITIFPVGIFTNAEETEGHLTKLTKSGNIVFWETIIFEDRLHLVYIDQVYGSFFMIETEDGWSSPEPFGAPFFDSVDGLDSYNNEISVFITNNNRLAFEWVNSQGELVHSEKWMSYLALDFLWETSIVDESVVGFETIYDPETDRFNIIYFINNAQTSNQLVFSSKKQNENSWGTPLILNESPYFDGIFAFQHELFDLNYENNSIKVSWINPANSDFEYWRIDPVTDVYEQGSISLIDENEDFQLRIIQVSQNDSGVGILWEKLNQGVCELIYSQIEGTIITRTRKPAGNQGCLISWQEYDLEGGFEIHAKHENRNIVYSLIEGELEASFQTNIPLYVFDPEINQNLEVDNYHMISRDASGGGYISLINGDLWLIEVAPADLIPVPEELDGQNIELAEIAHSHYPILAYIQNSKEPVKLEYMDVSDNNQTLFIELNNNVSYSIEEIQITDILENIFYIGMMEGEKGIFVREKGKNNLALYFLRDEQLIFDHEVLPFAVHVKIIETAGEIYITYVNQNHDVSMIAKDTMGESWSTPVELFDFNLSKFTYQVVQFGNNIEMLVDSYNLEGENTNKLEWISLDLTSLVTTTITLLETNNLTKFVFSELEDSLTVVVYHDGIIERYGKEDLVEQPEYFALNDITNSRIDICVDQNFVVQAGLDSFEGVVNLMVNDNSTSTRYSQTIELSEEFDLSNTLIHCFLNSETIIIYFSGTIDRGAGEPVYVDFLITAPAIGANGEIILEESIDQEIIDETETATEDILINKTPEPMMFETEIKPDTDSEWTGVIFSLIIPLVVISVFVVIRIRKNY